MRDRRVRTKSKLEATAREFARKAGLDWSALQKQCSEVVIFGSHAVGLESDVSDLDLLLVTRSGVTLKLPKLSRIDLVVRSEDQISSAAWLTSELAGHIAAYGQWLRGKGLWRAEALDRVGTNEEVAAAKRRRITRLRQSVATHWDRLTPDFRFRNLITIDREEQRLRLLESGLPVPPTGMLDASAEHGSFREVAQIPSASKLGSLLALQK